MKKISILVLVLLLSVCFAACGTQPEPEETAPSATIANPMQEVSSMEELCEKAGCTLIRPENVTVTDEAFFLIDGTPQIAQYDFCADGRACTLRFAKAGADTDICGVYNKDGRTLFSGEGADADSYRTDDVTAQRWFTEDGQYVFIVKEADNWDWEVYRMISEQFKTMEP